MMYGCAAWSIARDTGAGYTRRTIDPINFLQAKARRIISGAFKATSGPALDIELYLLPMTQQLWKHNAESIGRLCSSHDIPALRQARAFRSKKRTGRRKPHLSPLEHIFRRLYERRGPLIEQQELIPLYLVPPWWEGARTYIESTREIAIKKHRNRP